MATDTVMAVTASMANNRSRVTGPFLILCLMSVGKVAAAEGAAAGEPWFKPTLTLNERYSDNIELTANNKTKSFLTEFRPGFVLNSRGARGNVFVDYGLQALLYSHDSDASTHNHQLAATMNSHWLDKRLTLETNARVAQQDINTTDALGSGNYNLTGNRSETRSFGFSPAWKSQFGNDATFNARWQLTYVDSDASDLSSTTSNSINLGLSSGSTFNRIPWNISYQARSSDASSNNGNRDSSVTGTLGYVVSRKTRVSLTAGKDFNNGTSSGFDQASGSFWNVGIDWAPTIRTHLRATAGRRFSGSSYGLDFSHRTRKSTWALNYVESITDAYQQINGADVYLCEGPFLLFVPSGTQPEPGACGNSLLIGTYNPDNSLENQSSLSKSWSGVTTYNTGKSVFSLNIRQSRRESLASTINETDDIYNLSGNWSLRLSPRLSSTLSLASTHAENSVSQSDDWSLAWVLSYRLARQATGALELRRVERDSDSSTGPYTENSLSARLNMSF
jgi:uncharacterized protein (PEP-CTERM system associated)